MSICMVATYNLENIYFLFPSILNILKFRVLLMSHTANYNQLVELRLWQNPGFDALPLLT